MQMTIRVRQEDCCWSCGRDDNRCVVCQNFGPGKPPSNVCFSIDHPAILGTWSTGPIPVLPGIGEHLMATWLLGLFLRPQHWTYAWPSPPFYAVRV